MILSELKYLIDANYGRYFININSGLLHDISCISLSNQCDIENMDLGHLWLILDDATIQDLEEIQQLINPISFSRRPQYSQLLIATRAFEALKKFPSFVPELESLNYCDHCFPRTILITS